MWKKMLPLLCAPALLAGCQAMLTNLTPSQLPRNTNNVYQVELALSSRQQTLRWESIRPVAVVGSDTYELRPTPLMTNRWEGWVPVPASVSEIHYRYKLDFKYNAMGAPKSDSVLSREYTLRIAEP